MRKWHFASLLVVAVAALLAVTPALAQEPPPTLEFALADLGQRVGTTVTTNDLDSWFWEHTQYGDTSLGCPQPDQVYAQVLTPGYQFMLTYQGVSYDYRVSDDGQIVILCAAGQVSPTPTIGPVTSPAPTLPPAPSATPTLPAAEGECPDALTPRLAVGDVARTTPGLPSNLRAQADLNAQVIAQLAPGAQFEVIGGPTCGTDGLLWWQVNYNGQTGWLAQGEQDLYYVERVPQALPALADLGEIILESFGNLQELSVIQGNLTGAAVWSPDGLLLAIANANTAAPGVWIYDVAQIATPPRLLATAAAATAVAFAPDGHLAVGMADGTLAFWDLNQTEAPVAQVPAHQDAVLSITFSPDGRLLATVGEDTTVRLWGVPANVQG